MSGPYRDLNISCIYVNQLMSNEIPTFLLHNHNIEGLGRDDVITTFRH